MQSSRHGTDRMQIAQHRSTEHICTLCGHTRADNFQFHCPPPTLLTPLYIVTVVKSRQENLNIETFYSYTRRHVLFCPFFETNRRIEYGTRLQTGERTNNQISDRRDTSRLQKETQLVTTFSGTKRQEHKLATRNWDLRMHSDNQIWEEQRRIQLLTQICNKK